MQAFCFKNANTYKNVFFLVGFLWSVFSGGFFRIVQNLVCNDLLVGTVFSRIVCQDFPQDFFPGFLSGIFRYFFYFFVHICILFFTYFSTPSLFFLFQHSLELPITYKILYIRIILCLSSKIFFIIFGYTSKKKTIFGTFGFIINCRKSDFLPNYNFLVVLVFMQLGFRSTRKKNNFVFKNGFLTVFKKVQIFDLICQFIFKKT